jgi:hypothetical protein
VRDSEELKEVKNTRTPGEKQARHCYADEVEDRNESMEMLCALALFKCVYCTEELNQSRDDGTD